MSERDPGLEPYTALIGTWVTEATHPMLDAVVPGEVTFEWLGQYLIQRTRNEHALFPDALGVIDGRTLEYFDSRGVRRTYGVSLDGGVLRQRGEFPQFAQRFEAVLAPDRFTGQWQMAEIPGEWKEDLRVVYRRKS
jgi:hypothetical protein